MTRSAVAEHESGKASPREWPYARFDRVTAPIRVSCHKQRHVATVLNNRVLLQVRLSQFVARSPRIVMHDRVAPWKQSNATMFDVVILLDRTVKLSERRRKRARRETREVVAKQVTGADRGTGQDKYEDQVGHFREARALSQVPIAFSTAASRVREYTLTPEVPRHNAALLLCQSLAPLHSSASLRRV